MTVKVAVLVGSLRKDSLSGALAHALAEVAGPELDLQQITIGDLPFYNPDLDTDTPPEPWTRLRKEVGAAQAVLFVTPEYNRTFPAVIKNALDVGSRPYGSSVWDGKPAAIASQSPGATGGFGANHHLRQPMVFLNMPMMQQPEVYLSRSADYFDDKGHLTNDGTRDFLTGFMKAFAEWIERTTRS
ncbi:MAG: NAD(P)H-dependent oxidoreductase [Sphingobium sp.]|nr:NAD(P)H-dependent oxidoreductase [Sphingobium sp.]